MKTKRIMTALIAVLMVIAMIPIAALNALALQVSDKVKEVDLTIAEPVAGVNVDLDYSSVTVKHNMTYKVVGVNWYKNDSKEHLGTGNADKYFIGGESYTVRIDLALKGANSGWNFEYKDENTDYSGIKATINGKEAKVTYRELNPDSKTISVMYTFEYIPVKEITPIVYIPTPVAGNTYPALEKIETGSARSMIIAPSSYLWYVYENGKWRTMDLGEKFVAGEHYKVELDIQTTQGFKFGMSTVHQFGESRYIMGYINGRQTSMKLMQIGVNDDGVVYSDQRLSTSMEFVSCSAQELGSVSFSGVTEPSEGQKPMYTAPTMGDENYTLVTDDEITGGAQYGFVNGISWSTAGTAIGADSTFKKGETYTMSFFIKANDAVYKFSDWLEATADKGFVEVTTMVDNPTLAFVSITFAPCEGGVLNEINIGDVSAPVHGQTPDYDFTYGQGFGKGGEDPIAWYDVTADTAVGKNDTFVYGHKYELRILLASEAALNSGDSNFVFAPHASMKVKVNGKDADSVSAYAGNSEELWAYVTVSYDCAKAVIDRVEVKIDHPVEGNKPAQRIEVMGDSYVVDSFTIIDGESHNALTKDNVYKGDKNYSVVVIASPKEGYEINEKLESAVINGQEAFIFGVVDGKVMFILNVISDSLPYYFIGFNAGEGGSGYMDEIKVKIGKITLPDCDFVAPEGKQFLGWSTDGTVEGIVPQVITVSEGLSLTAMWESPDEHTHIYGDEFNGHDEFEHYKLCISPNCPQFGSLETKGETMGHNWGNNTNCDSVCVDCGYVRTVNQAGEPLHFYEHACSEICPNCGEKREDVTHTPGAAATCKEAQKCTVCNKTISDLAPHTPGEEANCGHGQTCTVCGELLQEATGEHTPGEDATCTDPQTCTVCGVEIKPANGHTAGVEWITDGEGHHRICGCGEKTDVGEHADGDGDKICDVCGYEMASGSSTGLVIALIVGAVAVLGGAGFCVYWFVIKKKK